MLIKLAIVGLVWSVVSVLVALFIGRCIALGNGR